MTGKTHMLVGVSAYAVLMSKNFGMLDIAGADVVVALGIIGVVPGALAPDIDIQGSTANRYVPFLHKIFTHRGFTHTLIPPILIYTAITSLSLGVPMQSILFGFLFGWLSHIFADMFNSKGVPLLYPFTKKKFNIMKVKTRSDSEKIFLFVWILVCVLLAYSYRSGGGV